jgi:ATP-dependent Clp protease ATP-binding subunit ClpA
MKACNVDLSALKKALTRYVDIDLKSLVVDDGGYASPTAGFQRVIQRAVIHVQGSGRDEVSSANVLVAIFSETESHAAEFLRRQGLRRFDALNFIGASHRAAETPPPDVIITCPRLLYGDQCRRSQ